MLMFERQRFTARIRVEDKNNPPIPPLLKGGEGGLSRKKIAQLIIARLDGKDIDKKFRYYQSLVKKGIGGFIIFGGKLKEVSRAIKRLQNYTEIPLFIASDLEQGLGQHVEGGTLFPPAMAIGQAINQKNKNDISLLRKSISIIAREAKAAGINTIFSPVLDVNTNPKNPIICTRAFSDSPGKVAWFGSEFIKGFQKHGIIACAKHFPGHGDTIKDSHKELPVVKADIKRLWNIELYPFSQAVKAGVKMIMIGHLKVPALDSKFPSTLSQKIMQGLLRERMRFKGLVITDAMNMHAIKLGEEKACLMALNAGADIILHPSNPEKIIDYLSSRWDEIMPRVEESVRNIVKVKEDLNSVQRTAYSVQQIGAKSNWETAKELTQKSIKIKGGGVIARNGVTKQSQKSRFFANAQNDIDKVKPVVLIIDDDNAKSGTPFVDALKKRCKKIKTFYFDNNSQLKNSSLVTCHSSLIIAVFSKISAWKGRNGLSSKLKTILEKSVRASGYSVIVGFCCPYSLSDIKADAVINAYSGSKLAQEAAGKILCGP
ncbi:MAG: glycoside hydrolase family 3 N-terminal domain-containing protein [Thermodesulfovibrionia bacterium]|nr:glycoside hydrolase family 3 N-terminal domain-containing protein [Thermodesulfovibrionia bacterium]